MSGWIIFLVVLCIALGINLWHSSRLKRLRQRRPGRRPTPPANAAAPTVRGRDLRSRRRWTVIIRDEVRSRGRWGGLVLFLIALFALVLSIRLVRWLGGSAEHPNLVVAVAPFSAPDGSAAAEGASVQQAMITEWSQGKAHRLSRPLQLVSLNDPLPDAQAALAIAQGERADVVIWGSVDRGEGADAPSLRPLLLWWPRQAPPHARAFGIQERIVLPVVYDLAVSPLNGQVVLGEILETLDMYQMGDYDGTIQAINTLLNRYVVDGPLRPDLLLGVRGAIASMQQQWTRAEKDYRDAIAATSPGRPEYWNNLGVALAAQGRTEDALQAFGTARTLLADTGSDLAAVHLNTGLLLLAGPDPASALPVLARANELAPRSVVTLVALADAQTRANQFGPAVASINRASELAPEDPLVALGLSRVQLAQLVGLGDRTAWELEISAPLPQEQVAQMRTRLDGAVATLEALATNQRAQATSSDAAGRPETGRVHEGAALQQSALLAQVRYWRAVMLTEEGIAAQAQPRGWLSRTWQSLFGDDPPLEQALATLQPLVRAEENDYDLRVQLARANRLLGIPKPALEHYTRATELDPNRPEAWYGVAITRWQSEAESDERNQAIRDALRKSLDADSRYTPAYLLCARIELRQKQWQAALPCLEWLHANRPDQPAAHVALGQVQRELGQLPQAELTLLPLANTNDGLALVELGRVYQAAGQPEAAETVFRRALQVNAGNSVAAYELGRLLEAKGDYGGAEQSYAQAIAANDLYMEAHLALGKLYAVHLNQPERAVQEYGRAIEAGGRDARTYEDLGREFLEMGQYKEAADALEESVRLNPNVPESRHALAQAYLELGRFDAAREQERAAIARRADGVYLDAQIGIAESFRRQGQHDEAITAYNDALDIDGDAVAAYVGLGRTAADKGDLEAAIGYYNQALAKDQENIDAHFWLGQALIGQEFYSAALAEFELVLASDPNNAIAYYGAGQAYSRLAETSYGVDDAEAVQYDAQARAYLDKALSLRPNLAEAWLERGIINERQSQLNAALSDYAQAANLNERDHEAPFLQGKLYLSLNNVEAATEALEISVRRNQRSADSQYWLGRAYRAQNRTADAIRQFQRAVELNGAYNEARYFQGLTEEDISQVDAARASYQAIIAQTQPDDRWRQQAEERLRELGQ